MSKHIIDADKLISELRKHLIPTVVDMDYDEWEQGKDAGLQQAIDIAESLQQEQQDKYETALEKAREWMPNVNQGGHAILIDIFPELGEGLDPRYGGRKQEQPEVDLEKEIDLVWAKCNPIDEGMGVEVANIHIEAFNIIASHFFELGLNAGREKSNGVDGVVHHALKSHWIVTDKNKLDAILKEFPEGAEVELFVCAKRGEKWK